MSAANLKAVATGQVAKTERPKTIAGLLTDPSIKQQMALALPKHMTADRLARIALTEVRKNPTLGKCDQGSFLGAIMQCAQLGLEPGGALGHAYLLPFENKRKQITEVQFIVGYRGMIDLARRSGQIVSLSARAVHAGDRFHYSYGLNETVDHVPAENGGGELTHVYAVAKLRDGGVQFEVHEARVMLERVRAALDLPTEGERAVETTTGAASSGPTVDDLRAAVDEARALAPEFPGDLLQRAAVYAVQMNARLSGVAVAHLAAVQIRHAVAGRYSADAVDRAEVFLTSLPVEQGVNG
jgi:phage RecT family recombinase